MHKEAGALHHAEPLHNEALALYRSDPATHGLDPANCVRPLAMLIERQGQADTAQALWKEARAL